jgi:hypothetical protein
MTVADWTPQSRFRERQGARGWTNCADFSISPPFRASAPSAVTGFSGLRCQLNSQIRLLAPGGRGAI